MLLQTLGDKWVYWSTGFEYALKTELNSFSALSFSSIYGGPQATLLSQRENPAKKKNSLQTYITRQKKSSPARCKPKRNCIKIHAHYNQKNYTLQTKLPYTANKTPARCKQKLRHAANKTFAHCKLNSGTLQTKLQHAANKTPARCKQNSSTLQTKELHATNKTPARCKQKQKYCARRMT